MTHHECEQSSMIKDIRANIAKLFSLSNPEWTRGLVISAIIALFVLYGGMYVYAGSTFATKADVAVLRKKFEASQENIEATLGEILKEVKKK